MDTTCSILEKMLQDKEKRNCGETDMSISMNK